jgi:hypothetical protein
VHFLAGNLHSHSSSFLSNAKSKGFHDKLVVALHGFSQSEIQRRGLPPESNDFLPRPCFPEVFLGPGAGAPVAGLRFYTMGSCQGWQRTLVNSKM